MPDYAQEEQEQIEAVKRWLKAYATPIIVGVLLALAGVTGFKQWKQSQVMDNQNASLLMSGIIIQMASSGYGANLSDEDFQLLTSKTIELQDNFSSTAYAGYASIALSRAFYVKGQPEMAEQHLRWAVENSKEADVQDLARLRLARVLAEQEDKRDEAIELLSTSSELYAAEYAEGLGDIYRMNLEVDKARVEYEKAMNIIQVLQVEKPTLQWKIDGLNAVAPQNNKGDSEE